MAVSEPVRRYYAERIFARTTRDAPPPNFRPLERTPTGRAVVEGCRGGGKNILELGLVAHGGRIEDLRASCGLCNPAMMAATDLAVDWARGRPLDEILALDLEDDDALAPILAPLERPEGEEAPPEDALEKLRYALIALRRAICDHLGRPPLTEPDV